MQNMHDFSDNLQTAVSRRKRRNTASRYPLNAASYLLLATGQAYAR
jgi:hypothetical protein